MTIQTSRRALLGVIALSPIAIAATGVPMSTALAGHAGWDDALARYIAARAASDRTGDALNVVEEAFFQQRPTLLDAIFHKGDTVEAFNMRVEADRERYRREDEACHVQCGVKAADEAHAAALDARTEAFAALFAVPVTDAAKIATKIEMAQREGYSIDELAPILTDLRNLSAGRA